MRMMYKFRTSSCLNRIHQETKSTLENPVVRPIVENNNARMQSIGDNLQSTISVQIVNCRNVACLHAVCAYFFERSTPKTRSFASRLSCGSSQIRVVRFPLRQICKEFALNRCGYVLGKILLDAICDSIIPTKEGLVDILLGMLSRYIRTTAREFPFVELNTQCISAYTALLNRITLLLQRPSFMIMLPTLQKTCTHRSKW